MITCPNCGAGNKPGSSACRMCAASLEGVGAPPAAPLSPGPGHHASKPGQQPEENKPAAEQEGIVCAECGTQNEAGWSFCQQCGKRLTKPAAAPPQPPAARVVADLRTVPEQRAVADPMAEGLRTNPEPQHSDSLLKTVVAHPPHSTEAPTIIGDLRSAEPYHSEPADSAKPSFETPAPPKPTGPAPQQIPDKPVAATPPPSAAKPSVPTPSSSGSRPERTTAHGETSGVLCAQCGQPNSPGSAFCASCGASMTFGKTMVISSQPAPPPPVGRLHLVMEGGQPGEIYDLTGDTVIGRNNGQITFPHDGFMSGRHARIERRGSSFVLTDEGSRNGTFIKTKGEVELKSGDMILVGKQLSGSKCEGSQ